MRESETPPKVGCGAIVWQADQVLLIRRALPPFQGQWSIPGGRQKKGETVRECTLRELREETGLEAEILGLIDVVDAIYSEGDRDYHFTLIDFAVRPIGGTPRANDDASEVRWFPESSLKTLGLWSETLRVIRAGRKFFRSP